MYFTLIQKVSLRLLKIIIGLQLVGNSFLVAMEQAQSIPVEEVSEEELASLQAQWELLQGSKGQVFMQTVQGLKANVESLNRLADRLLAINGKSNQQNGHTASPNFHETSDVEKCLLKGELYFAGEEVAQDFVKARLFFENVEKQGAHKIAQARAWVWLGKIYWYGYGVATDHARAQEYFEKGARQTDNKAAQAQAWAILAGVLYTRSHGQDMALVNELLAKAEAQDNLDALGYAAVWRGFISYEKGDLAVAEQFYEKLISHSNKEISGFATFSLGQMYYQGLGVEKDYEKARNYFQQAANQNVNKSSKEAALSYLSALDFWPKFKRIGLFGLAGIYALGALGAIIEKCK